MPKGKTPALQVPDGDWVCRVCGNNNYASRDACNKCGVSKDVYVSSSGVKPGDWICTSCNNHNWQDKMNCNKCGGPKTPTPSGMLNMKEGDWICGQCQNHNYASREK